MGEKIGFSSANRPIEAYGRREFWDVYHALYWHDLSQDELRNGIRSVAEKVKSSVTTADCESKPIRALVLGVGTGTFDFPLLSQLAEVARRDVHIVGIDSYPLPLWISEHILKEGLGRLPTRLDLKDIEETPGNGKERIEIPPHLLLRYDLDFDKGARWEEHAVFGGVPAYWREHLRREMGANFPAEGFDLVVTSFCLFHLAWWRHTLMHALSLLREGGVLLHPRIGGDEPMFEGRSPEPMENETLTEHRERTNVAQAVFQAWFQDRRVEEYLRAPRPATASSPLAISDMLEALSDSGVANLTEDGPWTYLLKSRVAKETYLGLLKQRGFSTFHEIEQITGRDYYEELFQQVDHTIENGRTDSLCFKLDWSAYRVTDHEKLLNSTLIRRFGVSAGTIGRHVIHSADRERELAEAMSNFGIITTENAEVPPKKVAEYLIGHLAKAGLFADSCIGGDIGLVTGNRSPVYGAFINPLFQRYVLQDREAHLRDFAQALSMYLLMLAHGWENRDFSNARLLLRELMPRTRKPCVFRYCLDERRVVAKNLGLEIKPHRDFVEIRFILYKHADPMARSRAILRDRMQEEGDKVWRQLKLGNGEPTAGKCLFYPIEILQKYKELARTTAAAIEISGDFSDKLSINLKEEIERQGDLPEPFRETLQKIITPDMVRTIIWLLLIDHWQTLVMFPATYYRGGQPVADDAVILFYDTKLDKTEIEHEYRKINLLYEQAGLIRAGWLGAHLARRNATHRLPGTIRALLKSLEEQKQHNPQIYISPTFYTLRMAADMQQEKVPRWERYEDLCRPTRSLTPHTLELFWTEVAGPVALERVGVDKSEEYRIHFRRAPKPEIAVAPGCNTLRFTDDADCAAFVSICCPVLLEAYQHSLMWEIDNRDEKENKYPLARVSISCEGDRIVVENPRSKQRRDLNRLDRELQDISRICLNRWAAILPGNLVNAEKSWKVTIVRRKRRM